MHSTHCCLETLIQYTSQPTPNGPCQPATTAGAALLVPCYVVKSLQLISRSYSCAIFKWVQGNYLLRQGTRIVLLVAARVTCPIAKFMGPLYGSRLRLTGSKSASWTLHLRFTVSHPDFVHERSNITETFLIDISTYRFIWNLEFMLITHFSFLTNCIQIQNFKHFQWLTNISYLQSFLTEIMIHSYLNTELLCSILFSSNTN